MLDAPADRLDRGRDHVAPVGNGGGAEHDHELGALAQHLVDRLGERACLVRHAALGDDAAPAGASRSSVTFRVFSITLAASPGSSVETTPTLRMR